VITFLARVRQQLHGHQCPGRLQASTNRPTLQEGRCRNVILLSVMSVEFRGLRWAIVAARHRSLRQVAETLNIRQSTLSRGLRDPEEKLGAVLFERTNGGTRPTIEGGRSSL
jgi:hypothetical protein